MIRYVDVVTDHGVFYEVERTHSDGYVARFKCSKSETSDPATYLDRLLSQHLSGTGLQRQKVDKL